MSSTMDRPLFIIILLFLLVFNSVAAQTLRITNPKTNDPINTDEPIEITWNFSNLTGNTKIQYSKTGSSNSWIDIDEVAVNEKSYYWYLPSELENYSGRIIIKISSSSMSWINDMVTIGSASYTGKKTGGTSNFKSYVNKKSVNPGGVLHITWKPSTTVNIYYSKTHNYALKKKIISSTFYSESYWWTVPDHLEGTTIKIIVEDARNKISSDPILVEVVKKAGYRTKSNLGLTVDTFYPNPGSYLNISWDYKNVVKLHYIRNSGRKTFVKSFSSYDNNYRMYIALGTKGDKLRIQITDNSGNIDYIDVIVSTIKPSTKHTTRSPTRTPPVSSSSNLDNKGFFYCLIIIALYFFALDDN